MSTLRSLVSLAVMVALLGVAPLTAFSAAAQGATQATPEASPVAVAAATPGNYDKTNWPSELNCGLFGGDDAEAALEGGKPLAEYLASWLGIPVEYTVGTSYNAVIESMRAGHTNCGTVGPFSYLLAVQEAGAQALAVEAYPGGDAENAVYDPAVMPNYFSVISVKKGNGIASIEDLKGKSFAFVDPASTSGYLIPSSELLNAGIDPNTDMETIFAGSHPTSALALWNGKVDAAASTESTLYNLAKEGQIDFCGFKDGKQGIQRTAEEIQANFDACPDGSIVPLVYSSPIPNTPFAVKGDLPESLKQAITDALLNIKNDPELIRQLGYWYIDPRENDPSLASVDAFYDPLREIAKQLGLDLKKFGQ